MTLTALAEGAAGVQLGDGEDRLADDDPSRKPLEQIRRGAERGAGLLITRCSAAQVEGVSEAEQQPSPHSSLQSADRNQRRRASPSICLAERALPRPT
mgnify:CR=1 FL=1